MIVEDQTEVVEFLLRPETYGRIGPVERIDTHGAVVFLVGDRAYKLKRAVRFPYMDFSTLERRRRMCEAELDCNRRTAPRHYLGVAAVTRDANGLRLGGSGAPVDWLVVMARFDQAQLLDRLAQRGRLAVSVMTQLARVIADFHRDAEVRRDYGDSRATLDLVDEIEASFAEGACVIAPVRAADLAVRLRAETSRREGFLDRRAASGFVRHCHGDLHLGNIVLDGETPLLFDAIEFNESLACNDVLYDLAFVLMDLEQRALRRHANVLFNEYLRHTHDYAGLTLLPLYLALRASIRAHVTATMACRLKTGREQQVAGGRAARYLELAESFLRPESPRMLAVGGVSGSGKSTLARGLSSALGRSPGALVLRSDVVRKELVGAGELDALPPDAYRPEVSRDVYVRMLERARLGLSGGQSVIVDATFSEPEQRRAAEEIAAEAGVPFQAFWLQAPATVLEQRVAERRDDASDATVAVLQQQLARDAGTISWRRLDASLGRAVVRESAEELIRRS